MKKEQDLTYLGNTLVIAKSAKNEVDAMNDANSKIIATSVQILDYTVEFYYDIFNEEEEQ